MIPITFSLEELTCIFMYHYTNCKYFPILFILIIILKLWLLLNLPIKCLFNMLIRIHIFSYSTSFVVLRPKFWCVEMRGLIPPSNSWTWGGHPTIWFHSTQFWHYLPGDSNIFHKLRVQCTRLLVPLSPLTSDAC